MTISDVICMVKVQFPGFHLLDRNAQATPCAGDLETRGNLSVLDVDGDRDADTSDILALAQYLFAAGAPPALGTNCFGLPEIAGCETNPACD